MSLDEELAALAAQQDVPVELLRRLLRHPGARRWVALRPDLPVELIDEIIALGSSRTLAANSSLPAAVRARLAQDPQAAVRAALAANASDDPVGLLAQLSQDPDPLVRSFLVLNDHLDPEIRARLSQDPVSSVRASIVQHWRSAPEHVRRRLLTDPEPQIRQEAVTRYAPPADLLPTLLTDRATRAAAVRYADPAPDMAADPDPEVRLAVAKHPALPADMRDQLALDVDIFVRDAIAARPDTPQNLRDTLIAGLKTDDPKTEMLLGFARTFRASHVCQPPPPAPPPYTREQAEDLLTRAGL